MKKKLILLFAALLFVILLFAVIRYSDFSPRNTKVTGTEQEQRDPPPPPPGPDDTTPPGTTVPSSEKIGKDRILSVSSRDVNEYDSADGIRYILHSFCCPVIETGDSAVDDTVNGVLYSFCLQNARITSADRGEVREYYEICRAEDKEFTAFEKAGSFTFNTAGILLFFRFTVTETRAGVEDPSYYLSICFDLTDGSLLSLADLLRADRETVNRYVISLFTDEIRKNPAEYYDDAGEILDGLDTCECFFAEGDGIRVYLRADIISPMVFGTRSVFLSYDSLRGDFPDARLNDAAASFGGSG